MVKRRMGRPRKRPGDVRDQQFHFVVSVDEKAELLEAAASVGSETPSAWVRAEILARARAVLRGRGVTA